MESMGGCFVYEGCPLPLIDGEMCVLSVRRRESQVPAHYHQNHWNNVCWAEGMGIPLYRFALRLKGVELQVWEKQEQNCWDCLDWNSPRLSPIGGIGKNFSNPS